MKISLLQESCKVAEAVWVQDVIHGRGWSRTFPSPVGISITEQQFFYMSTAWFQSTCRASTPDCDLRTYRLSWLLTSENTTKSSEKPPLMFTTYQWIMTTTHLENPLILDSAFSLCLDKYCLWTNGDWLKHCGPFTSLSCKAQTDGK